MRCSFLLQKQRVCCWCLRRCNTGSFQQFNPPPPPDRVTTSTLIPKAGPEGHQRQTKQSGSQRSNDWNKHAPRDGDHLVRSQRLQGRFHGDSLLWSQSVDELGNIIINCYCKPERSVSVVVRCVLDESTTQILLVGDGRCEPKVIFAPFFLCVVENHNKMTNIIYPFKIKLHYLMDLALVSVKKYVYH